MVSCADDKEAFLPTLEGVTAFEQHECREGVGSDPPQIIRDILTQT